MLEKGWTAGPQGDLQAPVCYVQVWDPNIRPDWPIFQTDSAMEARRLLLDVQCACIYHHNSHFSR
jgi:hypothetical protein